eukprot:2929264-Amphidinium_carterae.1
MANVMLSLLPDLSTPHVDCSMFLDDTSLYSEGRRSLTKAASLVKANMDKLGLEIQPPKCTFVRLGHDEGIEPEPLVVDGITFKCVDRTHLLGFDVHSCAVSTPSKPHATRAECAKERLTR